jgi:hypothetical protein
LRFTTFGLLAIPESPTSKIASNSQFVDCPLGGLKTPSLAGAIAIPVEQLRMLAQQGFKVKKSHTKQPKLRIKFSNEK